jgi:phenylalanyl-tRNA synthetase beta chain
MYIALNWLKELVDCNLDPEELAKTLTLAGFEVESIEDRSTWADGVVVGRVLTRIQHPNADKLSVCTVDVGGDEPLQIVCGAANVRAGIHVAVATVGTYLPKVDLKIKPAKLRGEKSEGMICSLSEVGLTKDSEGIHIFGEADDPATPAIGTDVRSLLGLDDVILDLSSTANRADALSMVGIAREVAALTGGALKLPTVATTAIPSQPELTVSVREPQACPVYSATLIRGVKVEPAPEWLQRRLQAAGIRPINNVVDVTNYILLEWGQPLHAFDADKLLAVSGSATIQMGVRYSEKQGETLQTLDGQERQLVAQNLLITAGVPVALAGVMGGETTEVGAGTQNIVLEAAIFDSVAVRKSARSQGGMRSEASTRYERGVNLAELEIATQRAIELIVQLAGGNIICQAMSDHRPDLTQQPRTINLRLERLNKLLGPIDDDGEEGEITTEDVERTLTALGCQLTVTEENVWAVVVPPYRYRDLEREIDLIEEVARLYGYDRFLDTLPAESAAGFLSLDEELLRQIRAAFRAVGLSEVVQYSYAIEKLNDGSQVEIVNPMFTEYSTLRSELVSGLIQSFQTNLAQGNDALQGFEISKVFGRDEAGLLTETDVIAGIMGGDPAQGRWTTGGKAQPLSWYEAKGMLDSVFHSLKIPVEYQSDRSNPKLHPGRTASLWLNGQKLGYFGQLHPQLRQEKDLPPAVYVFQLNLETILNYLAADERLVPVFKNYSSFPASDRDIAFFVSVDISLADIQKSIVKVGGELLEAVEVFDEYRGENVPDGQRSLAIRSIYRALDRTLVDADVEPLQQKVRDVLVEKFNVTLRS